MEIEERILDEVAAIRRLVELLAKDSIKTELNSVTTTRVRRRLWAMCDGLTSTKELASETGLSMRAVQVFISELQERDLVNIERRGYPKRKFDLVPADWAVKEVMRRG